MDITASKAEVNRLLMEKYGIDLTDVDEQAVESELKDGEEPEAIVDGIAEDYDLVPVDFNPMGSIRDVSLS